MVRYIDGAEEIPLSIAPSYVGQIDEKQGVVIVSDKRGSHWRGRSFSMTPEDLKTAARQFEKLAFELETKIIKNLADQKLG